MNDLQILYFLSVAETESITKSANQLYVSPPAVSRQILLIEEEMGGRLFERTGRGLRLLPIGARLRDALLLNQQMMTDIRNELHEQTHGVPPKLRFGVLESWNLYGMLDALRRVTAAHNCVLEVWSADTDRLLQWLASGQIELALVSTSCMNEDVKSFHQQYFRPLRQVIYYGAHGALGELSPTEEGGLLPLSQETLFFPTRYAEADEEVIRHFCFAHGFLPRYFVPSPNLASTLNAVGAGLGIALLDEWCWAFDAPSFGKLVFSDQIHTSLFWRGATESPFLRSAIDYLMDWRDRNL